MFNIDEMKLCELCSDDYMMYENWSFEDYHCFGHCDECGDEIHDGCKFTRDDED